MKCVATIWYVPFSDLVDHCLIGCEAIKWGIKTGSPRWQSIADPDDRRKRLIRYDTMAPKYQAIVRRVLCKGYEPGEMPVERTVNPLSQRSLSEQLEIALKEGYRRYTGMYPASDTTREAQRTQTCLARAAAVIELIGSYIQQTGNERSYAPYKEVLKWLEQDGNYAYYFPIGNQYLPTHKTRLKEKVIARFGKVGVDPLPITDVIHLPRKDNKSREKFGSDKELLAWIAIARSQGTNDTNAYVERKISEVCRVVGRDVPSRSWFSKVLADPKLKQLTAPGRFGAGTKQASRYTHSITMARAMYAGDCWMMDATRVNFIEHRCVGPKTSVKDQFGFLFVIVVRDAYSGDVVGCHFDTKEDRWGYTNALKMAVKTTGYLPHTLVYDRFPGHVTDEMQSILGAMEAKGVKLVCTHKATGKALLERWFDTLQTVFLAQSRYYYGQGIMSTRDYAHRSADYLLKVRKEAKANGFDFDQAWQEAWQRIEQYRQTPVSYYSGQHKGLDLSPATLHEQSEKPHVIDVPLWEQASLFWMTKVLDIRRNRIEQEVHGVRYEYPIYDTRIMYAYERLAIRYEEADPTKIMLFAVGSDDKVTDFFIGELTHVDPVVMYGPDAQSGRLAGRMEKIDQFEKQKRADLEQITNAATVDPEYLLAMGGKVSKDEYESVQTAVIYEHMGVVVTTKAQEPANQKRARPDQAKPVPPKPAKAAPIDTTTFITQAFYNQ